MSVPVTEATLAPAVASPSSSKFVVEHEMLVRTGVHRHSIKASNVHKIKTLRNLFAKVEILGASCEVRQVSMIGDGANECLPTGHIYVALIPTVKDTDLESGANAAGVNAVANKQTFPLDGGKQNVSVYNFSLTGYEVDLAQDPRRGAGVVLWVGNSGVRSTDKNRAMDICSVTWRIEVECSGATSLWV